MAAKLLDTLLAKFAANHARLSTRRFFRAVADARRTQQHLLADILRRAAASDFGKRHGFDKIRNDADFRREVPIRTYADIADDIERVRRGDTTALLPPGSRVLMFAMTSGTTAQPKYIPVTSEVLADCRRGWNIWGLKALLDHPGSMLRHIVQVVSPMNDHVAPGGAPCGAITGLLAATQKKLVRRYYTTHPAVAHIPDAAAKYYTIMRLAIVRDVSWMVTANPATLITLARTANDRRAQLIRDVHDGKLDESLPIPNDVRAVLWDRLKPDKSRAKQLESLAARHDALLPQHYWRLSFLAHWTGGTMGLYRPQIRQWFGETPVRDIGLIASEGRMSIPIDDETATGVLAVTGQFFEFIPADQYGRARPDTLLGHELQVGAEYFVVLTNAGGLYRYDLGDRVRVTGFLGEAPMIEFLSRDAHTCSLTGEKLTEHQVVAAVQSVAIDPRVSALQGRVAVANRAAAHEQPGADFIVAPVWGEPPHYRLYVEENATGPREASPEYETDLAARFDAALCKLNIEYESKRASLRLGPVQVVMLPTGTIARRDAAIRAKRSHTSEQFKHQYLLTRPGSDDDLNRR
ncbi:GH3 auxin-responsive promoter [Phycisphaerae bacterium RAS2]|nr:GH3 auxin-responsive promoter [Phycisphaerae bacterium RAS2]